MGYTKLIAPPALILVVAAVLLMGAMGVFKSQTSFRINTTSWWFYLMGVFVLVFLALRWVISENVNANIKMLFLFFGAAIFLTGLYQAYRHIPMDTGPQAQKTGLVPAPVGSDGNEVYAIEDGDTPDPPPEEAAARSLTIKQLLPAPMDQGLCGSCWAVASATVIGARYNKMLQDAGKPLPSKPVFNCVPADVDQSLWWASPQYLVDMDPSQPQGECSSGKCNGNTAIQGFKLAEQGVPTSTCVPYFLASTPSCRTSCKSPVTQYVMCPGGSGNHCLKPPGEYWETCPTTGEPLKKSVKTTHARYVLGHEAMKKEIDEKGPLLCGINFYEGADWTLTDPVNLTNSMLRANIPDQISEGFVARPRNDPNYTLGFEQGGHAVTVYGYGTTPDGVKYWNVRNSWGKNWGIDGDVKIERGINAWNIESMCATADVEAYVNQGDLSDHK